MGKPFNLAPFITPPPDLLAQAADEIQAAQQAALVPSTVTASWDYYRRTLGQTVPYNVNRARAVSGSYMRLVR